MSNAAPGILLATVTKHAGNSHAVEGMAEPERPGLDDIIVTELLHQRPSRPADHAAENRVLVALARAMAESPRPLTAAN